MDNHNAIRNLHQTHGEDNEAGYARRHAERLARFLVVQVMLIDVVPDVLVVSARIL